MFRKVFLLSLVIASMASLSACDWLYPNRQANMANPASVYCEEHGGRVDMRQDASGGTAGVCVFADGSECDEWAFFRGECPPGNAGTFTLSAATAIAAATSAAESAAAASPNATPGAGLAADGWNVYTNEEMGYSFHYPADATLEGEDPARSISVVGPLKNDEHWPVFSVNHPDRADFHPPEGADLAQWLEDHNLTGGKPQEKLMIGALEMIHIRIDNGQAYNEDRYYFARAGQLFEVIILHAGKEDWAIYNQFLRSIRFE